MNVRESDRPGLKDPEQRFVLLLTVMAHFQMLLDKRQQLFSGFALDNSLGVQIQDPEDLLAVKLAFFRSSDLQQKVPQSIQRFIHPASTS
jgi:hypothetical protein